MARGADDLQPSDIALSDATGDAVHAAGKQEFVARTLRRGQTTVNNWGNIEQSEFIPLRLVPALERLATGQDGHPHITRALAQMQGYELYALPSPDMGAGDWLAQLGTLSSEGADIIGKVCTSLADQRVCARDVRQHGLIAEAEQLVRVAVTLLAGFRAVAGE